MSMNSVAPRDWFAEEAELLQEGAERTEDAVERAHAEELEARVLERTAELEAAVRELEAFSYSVSHDLRAPLRHINSYCVMLIEDFGPVLPPEARDYLDRLKTASNRMGDLIDHLLNLSRVSRAVLTPTLVDLSKMAAEIFQMFQETEPQRRVEPRIQAGIKVRGDLHLLYQLLINLLGNAWKYTSKEEFPFIEFGRVADSEEAVYFIKDNGCGFNMAYQASLFKAFERLHGDEFKGLGIGLATAHRVVQRHGGRIWAESDIGRGATFLFTLPVSSP